MTGFETIGFIGLGVMGEPMCRNLVAKMDVRMIGFDIRPDPLESLADIGVISGGSVAELARDCDLILLSLPGRPEVEEVCLGADGIASTGKPGLVVADLSTCPVDTARKVGAGLEARGIDFADAPVTRTAAAALDGTLSIMVGAPRKLYERLKPVLLCMGTDVTHTGAVGSAQILKLMNNMVCVQTVVALAEAMTIAKRAGVEPELLFDVLGKGSADSFALRNHGMKSLLPGTFPTRKYSTRYAIKDTGYAVELAKETGIDAAGAELALELMARAEELGYGENYYPALVNVVDDSTGKG